MTSQGARGWRILAVEDELSFHGGQERSYLEVCTGLAAGGSEIHLASRSAGDAEPAWARVTSGNHRMGTAMLRPEDPLRSAIAFAGSVQRACRARPNVVYLNQYQDTPLGALVALRCRAPLVCHLRQPVPARYGIQWAAAMPRVTRFIAVSDHTKREFVRSGLPPESVVVVPLGVDGLRFAPDPVARAEERRRHGWDAAPVVLYAGRIDREKGLEVLIEAWKRFAPDHVGARLVIAGSPRNHPSPAAGDAYAAELRALGAPNITWLPRRTDVASLYAAADVVVLPSTYAEPSGRTILEGMATGVPVLASNTGGIPEFYGALPELLVPVGDAAALAAKLTQVVTWRTTTPVLGERCRETAERFSLAATVDGVRAVIADALTPEGARRRRATRRGLWGWGRQRT